MLLPPLPAPLRRFDTRIAVLTLAVFLAALWAFAFVQSQYQERRLRALLAEQQYSVASYVAADVNNKIALRVSGLAMIAKLFPTELLDDHDALEHFLAERRAIYNLFSLGLIVVRPDGHGAFADYPVLPNRITNDYSDVAPFKEVIATHTPAVGPPRVGRAAQRPVVVIAAPILKADGSLAAVLAGVTAIDTPNFLDLVANQPLGATGGFAVGAPDHGVFVIGTDPSLSLQPLPAAGTSPLYDRFRQGWEGTGVGISPDGVEEVLAGRRIPVAHWFVIARLPTAEAFAPIRETRNATFITSTLLSLLVALGTLLIVRRGLRPLRRVATELDAMTSGEQPLHALPDDHATELSKVVRSFNLLQAQLNEEQARLRESESRLRQQAHYDALTKLPNRVCLEDRLRVALAQAKRQKHPLAVAFLDLDGFKPVNDELGHDAGDLLLIEVACRLSDCVRAGDTVARLGGDEFVIVLSGLNGRDEAEHIIERVLASLCRPFSVKERECRVSASIGLAHYPGDGDLPDVLLRHADAAMYEAKRQGGHRQVTYAKGL